MYMPMAFLVATAIVPSQQSATPAALEARSLAVQGRSRIWTGGA